MFYECICYTYMQAAWAPLVPLWQTPIPPLHCPTVAEMCMKRQMEREREAVEIEIEREIDEE
jgi:hypothetical protein